LYSQLRVIHGWFDRLLALRDVSHRPGAYPFDSYELVILLGRALLFPSVVFGEIESPIIVSLSPHGEHGPSSYNLYRRKPTADTFGTTFDLPSRKILDINEIYAVFVACASLMSASMMDDA
jgi:hypothetical protein